jgi:hypothetical protein
MAVTITQRPSRSNEDLTSRWTAAHNPVIYKFQRRDRSVTAVIVVGDEVRFTLDDATGLEVGYSVYVGTSKYKGYAVIESISSNFVYTSGLTPNGSDGAGYMNDTKRNYKINIKIYESGNNRLLGSTACVPFTNGAGTKDVGVYVAAYLKLINTFPYDVVNLRDVNSSIKFYITFQEVWTGGSVTLQSDISNPIYAMNAARQIGDNFGQNYHDYVLVYPNVRLAKFLTKFKRPVYFKGKPFAIGFIHSELLGVQLSKVERQLNANMVQVDEGTQALDIDQKESVNHMTIDGDYPDTVKYIALKINSGAPASSGYVYPGYVEDGYVEQI